MIVGAGRQGIALARYLSRCGAIVTLNDSRGVSQLSGARESLSDVSIKWVMGSHPLDLLDEADLLAISGGVPLTLPLVKEAQKRGIPLTNDSQIFMDTAPCRVIGITGSAGKTTTTTLVGRMAKAEFGAEKVWVGGNIGNPLIADVDKMKADDLAIMELSSFQLEQMTTAPQIAAVLNITPNHLDRHGTMDAYTAAKARIIEFQKPEDIAILGREDKVAWGLAKNAPGQTMSFGVREILPPRVGTYLQDGEMLTLSDGASTRTLFSREKILLRGEHNLLNILAACAIAHAAGISPPSMQSAVENFAGVEHRLEFVRQWQGAKWYNDSIATAPERAIAALKSFDEPLVLLAGGRDKNLPWEKFAKLVQERVRHIILFGDAAALIEASLGEAAKTSCKQTRCGGLKEAVQAAAQIVEPGDVVLLSPGGTSFDEFRDFAERGEWFRKWVHELE